MNFIWVALLLIATLIFWVSPIFIWQDNKKMREKIGKFLVVVNIPLYYSAFAPAFFEQPRISQEYALYLRILGGVLLAYGVMVTVLMIVPKMKRIGPGYNPKELVIEGIFRWVRHPQISGLMAFSLGSACWSLGIYHLYLNIAYAIIYSLYLWIEEKYMSLPIFGEEYIEYKKTTPAWIPFWF